MLESSAILKLELPRVGEVPSHSSRLQALQVRLGLGDSLAVQWHSQCQCYRTG